MIKILIFLLTCVTSVLIFNINVINEPAFDLVQTTVDIKVIYHNTDTDELYSIIVYDNTPYKHIGKDLYNININTILSNIPATLKISEDNAIGIELH